MPKFNKITEKHRLLCKELSLDSDGNIKKISHGRLLNGLWEEVEFSKLTEVSQYIKELTHFQVLNNGFLKSEFKGLSQVTTKKRVVDGESFSRSKNCIEYRKGESTLLLIDSDDKSRNKEETRL